MAENTDYLSLYKKDPVTDKNDTFNITTMLNENWDKLDVETARLNTEKVEKEAGKGLSANDYDDLAVEEVAKIKEKVTKELGKVLSSNDYTDEEMAKLTKVVSDLVAHDEEIASVEGRHGIRYWQEKLWVKESGEWIEFKSGMGFKVGNTEGFKVEAKAGLQIEIKFGDPNDSIVIDENQDEVVLAKWKGTMVRGKKNSYPIDEKDGQLVVDNKLKNKHKTSPFVYKNLTNGDDWYFMAFPYTENDVYTVDASNRARAKATNKLDQPAPAAPTISNLEYNKATVRGGDSVSLDKSSWHDSPHTFTGLTKETGYTAYAKKKETPTYLESPISPGKSFTTPSDLPGPSDLVGGDTSAGYFGLVSSADLITGVALATEVGITQGTSQFSDDGWLKFAIDGKIIYKSKKPFRHSISWDHINSKGCVKGTKEVTINGTRYKVRLMKTGTVDPMPSNSGKDLFGSEWNRLMYPIHINSETDSGWYTDGNVEKPTPKWGVKLTNEDLGVVTIDGRYHWCQETRATYRLLRGNAGVSHADASGPTNSYSSIGWSPVLEVIS